MLHSGSIIKTGYQTDMLHGRILTPDGLRVLCASLDNDPEKIGKHMLEMLAKFRSEGLFNVDRRQHLKSVRLLPCSKHPGALTRGVSEMYAYN